MKAPMRLISIRCSVIASLCRTKKNALADVRAMPVFPAEGSIRMIDGVLVVHIGKQHLIP